MFRYQLPDGGIRTHTKINLEGQIKFDPPVYEQRYITTIRILEDEYWSKHFKKVVDFGCSEMRLLTLLRRVNNLEHILEVDIDEDSLVKYQSRAVPLVSDYLNKRERPLRLEVLKGSIISAVENVKNVDVVIALEVIEHLEPHIFEKVPENIFGFIQPKLAIFSTPNSEFNVLFPPLLPNGFRHEDHKFEWTRKEFKQWALDICKRYPNYAVTLLGVGNPPPDNKKMNVGHVTQIAIFARHDIRNKKLMAPLVDMPIDANPDIQYKSILVSDFPYDQDDRTTEQKILNEVVYTISRCNYTPTYFNREREVFQIPLDMLKSFVASVGSTQQELRKILSDNEYNVDGDYIILPKDYYTNDRYDDLDEMITGPDGDDWLDHGGYGTNPEDDVGTENSSSNIIQQNYEVEEDWD